MIKTHPLSNRSKKLDVIEEYGLKKVTGWTQQQLANFQKNSRYPLCMALQNGDFLVATYRVEKISDICWKVENFEFTDKRSAIFYCSLLHISNIADANELRKIDEQVGKLDLDKSLFRVRLDAAHIANDQFKIDFYSSRYEEVKGRLRLAKQELEKIISCAKYSITNLGNKT